MVIPDGHFVFFYVAWFFFVKNRFPCFFDLPLLQASGFVGLIVARDWLKSFGLDDKRSAGKSNTRSMLCCSGDFNAGFEWVVAGIAPQTRREKL